MRFVEVEINNQVEVNGVTFELLPVNHIVPACGYRVTNGSGSFAFSGDTTTTETLWQVLNSYDHIDMMFVEAAFSNNDLEISKISKHYCPQTLGADLIKLRHRPDIWLTHFKPGDEDLIYRESVEALPDFTVRRLNGGEIFKF